MYYSRGKFNIAPAVSCDYRYIKVCVVYRAFSVFYPSAPKLSIIRFCQNLNDFTYIHFVIVAVVPLLYLLVVNYVFFG